MSAVSSTDELIETFPHTAHDETESEEKKVRDILFNIFLPENCPELDFKKQRVIIKGFSRVKNQEKIRILRRNLF